MYWKKQLAKQKKLARSAERASFFLSARQIK